MTAKMFAEVHHELKFSLNVYRGDNGPICFDKYTHAFLPSQIEDSYADPDGRAELPGIKARDGTWDTRGHRDRLVQIDHDALSVIHAVAEDDTVPVEETRFIQPYSAGMLDVFRKLARFPKLDAVMASGATTGRSGKDGNVAAAWQMSAHWHEVGAQKDGTIKRQTGFRPADEMILQGPHFHVGNPVYKTARKVARTNADYDVVDLILTPDDYLPRTNYAPAVSKAEYRNRMTRCRWDAGKAHSDFYRVGFRKMINLNSERSLVAALLPVGCSHIDSVQSVAFEQEGALINFLAFAYSILPDFLTKASGRQNLHDDDIGRLPWNEVGDVARQRALRLSCLTSSYADLWNRFASGLVAQTWSSDDKRLSLEGPVQGPSIWNRSAGLRSEFSRRLALVEIDVLVAMALGLSLAQLVEIYRIYFPVQQENEAGTWYDQQGRIVWTCSKGLPGVGWLDEKGKSPGRSAWEKILASHPAELACVVSDDTQPDGPRKVTRHFVGPFTTCDRIEDYNRAWAHFERLKFGGSA